MKTEFFTIAEFAAAVGLTPQAVYKRLQTDLKPYVKEVDGKKRLSKEAFELFEIEQVENDLTHELKETINLLKMQIDAKDKQIEALQRALEQQQQLNAATLQTFKALPSEVGAAAEDTNAAPKKHHWWQR